jgi:SAM-dependent methyltransferase
MIGVDNRFRREDCPACGARRLQRVGILDYGSSVTFATTPIQLTSIPELWACEDCGTWFSQHIVGEADARRLYAEGNSDVKWRSEPFEAVKSPAILGCVDGLVRGQRAVADIGCNTGELLDFCAARQVSTAGVELSASSRRICEAKGHLICSSIAELAPDQDVMFAFDLVEHLHDLPAFITSIHGRLRSGGHLVVLTGDNTGLVPRLTRERWWYLRYPEHIVFPSVLYWAGLAGFRLTRRLRIHASVGYRASPLRRLWGLTRMLAGRGNGLPLFLGDHHLLVLTRI